MRSIVLISLISLSACSARETVLPASGQAPDSGPSYDPTVISVPFLVDDQYVPSGCMGDCVANVSIVRIDDDCPMRGTSDAQGECHHFVYSADADAGALGWAGVLWQTVDQNWGQLPGRAIAPGASAVHFYAMGKVGGEALTILLGGLNAADGGKTCDAGKDCASAVCASDACTQPFHDTLNLSSPEVLSSSFQSYDISLLGKSYGSEVLSGFGWTATAPPTGSTIEFYVDDLRWE